MRDFVLGCLVGASFIAVMRYIGDRLWDMMFPPNVKRKIVTKFTTTVEEIE